jgi:hypothetical protein
MLKGGLLDAETVHYLSGGLGILWSWNHIEPMFWSEGIE